jgi:uncharacterized protein DUF6526
MPQEQSLKSHVRFDPPYHFFLFPLAVVLTIAAIIGLVRSPGWQGVFNAAAGVWAVLATLKFRLYALKVQDRVIRLEERLRLHQICSPDFRPRIGDLKESQLVALRFASDAEAPELAEKALTGNWNQKQIKEAVRNWRSDFFRV